MLFSAYDNGADRSLYLEINEITRYGDQFDETKLKELPTGSVYSEVAGQNHFAMTKEPVIVSITGYGPSGVKYVNALDDPEH